MRVRKVTNGTMNVQCDPISIANLEQCNIVYFQGRVERSLDAYSPFCSSEEYDDFLKSLCLRLFLASVCVR